ncbi:hypothetical protein ACP70R_009079 [Stipagrostis hirtigluma subsp. patula]
MSYILFQTLKTIVQNLFQHDHTTGAASVELWVVMTTLLLLANFAVDSIGPRVFSFRRFIAPVHLLHILKSYSVIYTLGLMKLSSSSVQGAATVNDLFQIWAVLIVTMQDSVRIGLPYSGKQMTLVDLLSSLWSADQLRGQTRLRLKVPLWLIWSIHASRVIWYYFANNRATEASLRNIKLVSDYMTASQHADGDACPRTMHGYRYIVAGEEEQRMEVRPPNFTFEMNLEAPEAAKLLTLDKVWSQGEEDKLLSAAADRDNRFKDICLSYALYKLQRRRFHNFPIAEAMHQATGRLVSGAILEEGANGGYERALRVTDVELSFLHDYSYSKHAVVFATGFPYGKLLLSLLMAAAALYLAYAVRDIPSTGTALMNKDQHARITHGVLVTHCIIGIIIYRELLEVVIYVLSQWTKVLVICHYIKLKMDGRQGWMRKLHRLITEKLGRIMFFIIRRGQWNQRVRQHNLLTAKLPGNLNPREVKLRSEVKRMLFQSLKDLIDKAPDNCASESAWTHQMGTLLLSYFRNAFVDIESSQSLITDTVSALEGATRKILVWHIATSICQIKLLEEGGRGSKGNRPYTLPRPFGGGQVEAHYATAVTLSNYCVYLVTEAMVPDNGLVANMVFRVVRDEVRGALRGCRAAGEIRQRLLQQDTNTIAGMGAQLSEMLLSTYKRDDMWERLAKFWAGFLLHLSASTKAAKHQIRLKASGELTTHLWVLLSHAGFLGESRHGEQLLDPDDLNDA